MLTGRRKTRITLLRNWRASPRFVNKSLPYMHHQVMIVSLMLTFSRCSPAWPRAPSLACKCSGEVTHWNENFPQKKMAVELVHLFCVQGAFGWREGIARVCSWCHRQRSQGGLTSRFDQFMLAPLVTRRENTILYLSWIRFGKSINLFWSVSSLVWFW